MTAEGLLDTSFGGVISSAYLIFYGIGQFINGRLGVKISPKIMVSVGLIGSGCANILMGCSSHKYIFLVLWAINGFFNSMLWSPIIRVFTDWIIESRREFVGANISLTIPLGMTLSYLIASLMLQISNWRGVFIVCGTLLCIGGLIWIFGVARLKDYINAMNERNTALFLESVGENNRKPSLSLKLFFGSGIILVAVVALFNGSLKDAVVSWAPTYFKDTYAFSDSAASLVSTLMPIFSVAGPYVAVFINKRFLKNEVATSGILFASSALCLLGLVLLKGNAPLIAVVLLALSMCFMWGVNTMILTFVPYRFSRLGISSAVTGTLNCTAYIAASSCTVLYGSMSVTQDWSSTVILWTVFAVSGAAVCFILSRLWRKLRPDNT